MEANQQQNQQLPPNDDHVGGGGGKSNFLCRQSSTRWTPTTEQIRILKDLYYNNGVRSPSADQIQKISAKLRQYGKIEGKNVFYWFQNHKARERQKKRLTATDIVPMHRSGLWRPDQESFYNNTATNKYPNMITTTGAPSSSTCSPGLTAACSQVGNYGYGSLAMEKSFRDCSLSTGFNGGNGAMANNFSWPTGLGVDPIYSSSPYHHFFDKKSIGGFSEEDHQEEEEGDDDDEEEEEVQGKETLPLFPMHAEDISAAAAAAAGFNKQQQPNCYYPTNNWYHYSNGNMACSRASLELSLNSYGGGGSRSNNSP